jgi:hypothetical protein
VALMVDRVIERELSDRRTVRKGESWQEAAIVICMWRSCQSPTNEIFVILTAIYDLELAVTARIGIDTGFFGRCYFYCGCAAVERSS